MGKLSFSTRKAKLPMTALLNKNSTNLPVPQKPHFPAKKTHQDNTTKSISVIGPQIPSITFNSPNLSEAKTRFSQLISTPRRTPFDARCCNSVIQSFSAIGSLQDSIFFLNYMIKALPSLSPDRSTYHILLIRSCKEPESSLSAVHKVFNFMNTQGFPPDKVTTDIAVRTLCSVGREENAIELVKDTSAKGSPPDSYTYNFLVKHLVKNRELSTVKGFINEMREGFDVKPDIVTYTIMIDNVCNKKNIREASRLLGLLKEEGFKPDCYVYNTIMKGHCMLSQSGEVMLVYNKMLEEGVKPDLVTYNTLIYGLSKSGRVKQAKRFLGVMTDMGHFPDAVTYTSLMNGMCREGDTLGAVSLLEDMESRGCSPNSCTYNTLLHGLCKARLLDKCIALYKVMKEGNMEIEPGAYGTFVRTLIRDGRVADAYEVFDYAVESKSMTDVAAYSTLESTLKWLQKARQQGLVV